MSCHDRRILLALADLELPTSFGTDHLPCTFVKLVGVSDGRHMPGPEFPRSGSG